MGEGQVGEGRVGEEPVGEGQTGEERAGEGPVGEGQAGEGQTGEGQGRGESQDCRDSTEESGQLNKAHGMGETTRDNKGGIRTGRDRRGGGGTSHQLPAEGGSWTSAGPSLDQRNEGAEEEGLRTKEEEECYSSKAGLPNFPWWAMHLKLGEQSCH